jgi:hypothetical protein
MNDAKLLEAVRMMQDATNLLEDILVEQIGKHNVISTAPRIEYDALNKVTGWKPNQVLTEQPDYNLSNVTQPGYDVSNVAPKFDPNTADKNKMYFAVHPEYGEGVVWHRAEGWWFESKEEASANITNCTHIDHEQIQRKN